MGFGMPNLWEEGSKDSEGAEEPELDEDDADEDETERE